MEVKQLNNSDFEYKTKILSSLSCSSRNNHIKLL
jgi:hypothetical protein